MGMALSAIVWDDTALAGRPDVAALAALRGVCRACWRMGLMDGEQLRRVEDVPSVRGERLPAGRVLTIGEVAAILDACNLATEVGQRDAALLAVLFGAGLRRGEVVALDLASYDAANGVLRVMGKGRKEREVPLPGGARAALADYLAARGEEAGPLFLSTRPDGDRRLNGQSVLWILQRAAKRAGVRHVKPHDARRTYCTGLLDFGVETLTVSKLMGHANPRTTMMYDRRGLESARRAVNLLHVPYRSAEERSRDA